MSTRATYQFTNRLNAKTTFYIHHDGYPEGAAAYFMAAMIHKTDDPSPHESLAERFIRANTRAELSKGHDDHGDTEYQYDYDCKTNKVTARKIGWNNRDAAVIFNGTLEEFVNKYGETYCGQFFADKKFVPFVLPVSQVDDEAATINAVSFAKRVRKPRKAI